MNDISTQDSQIGDLIRSATNLTQEQIDSVLEYQKKHKLRFGEAAVALGYTKREDIVRALSQQFQYSYIGTDNPLISPELVVARRPFSDEAEFFRDIRSTLLSNVFLSTDRRKALAIVSPNPGGGKSFFAANLAVSLSQLGGRTALVDADMRTPRQHEIFSINDSTVGLSNILSGRADNCLVRPISELPSLYVMPVGTVPPNPLELVQRAPFSSLIKDLLEKFDHVIVDTPAASNAADARVISAQCGSALIVARRNASKYNDTSKILESLKRLGVTVPGVIYNDHRG